MQEGLIILTDSERLFARFQKTSSYCMLLNDIDNIDGFISSEKYTTALVACFSQKTAISMSLRLNNMRIKTVSCYHDMARNPQDWGRDLLEVLKNPSDIYQLELILKEFSMIMI